MPCFYCYQGVSMIYPEFATCGDKMEPPRTPFLLIPQGIPSVYAGRGVLRKCTYIYDLHENFYLCFDMSQLRPPVQLGGDMDSKSIQDQLQVWIIYIHEPIQVTG